MNFKRIIAALCMCMVFGICAAQGNKDTMRKGIYGDENQGGIISSDNEPFTEVDIKEAEFPGGTAMLLKWFKDSGLAGYACSNMVGKAVVLRFVVNQKGSLSKISVQSDPSNCPEYSSQALKLLIKSPQWIPAQYKGKYVSSWTTLSVPTKLE